MANGSTQAGRLGSTGTFENTIAPKSAEQAMLMKIDEIVTILIAMQTAIAASTDGDSLQTGLNVAAITTAIAKIRLVR